MSETVSKTKNSNSSAGSEAAKRKTSTNWRVLTEGGFLPARIRCDGYKGNHPADLSCHTAFHPSGENVVRHMNPDHGLGTFKVKFRISDGKQSPLWEELEAAGVEIQDLYCPHCRSQVALVPRQIIAHLQPHAGANRINLEPQTLCMTLGYNKPDEGEYDNLYESSEDR